jgi:hypothetical protein
VPITFRFKVAGWADELARHAQRLRGVEGRVFLAMMGRRGGQLRVNARPSGRDRRPDRGRNLRADEDRVR